MNKIKLTMEMVDGEIFDDGINFIDRVVYRVRIGEEQEKLFDMTLIREINGEKYSINYMKGLVLLEIVEYIRWSREYDFSDKEDVDNFVDNYGFSCGTVCEIVGICNKLDKIIEGKFYLTDEELNEYADIASDGGKEEVAKAKKELEKYFAVEVM